MSRGLGRIGRAIVDEIERSRKRFGTVQISSWDLLCDLYVTDWEAIGWQASAHDFTPAQRKAVTRAMHGFVRRHQQYALAGGQGRKRLYLYEPDDPLSAIWVRLQVANRKRHPVSRSEAASCLVDQVSPAIEQTSKTR